ncbi:MAG TPA: 4Fe-4S dicluster domain-containing protein [Longimicrobium sp.]|nr:4Fe-4S dicluster domain-containing protein [Longimicrobium sp.]
MIRLPRRESAAPAKGEEPHASFATAGDGDDAGLLVLTARAGADGMGPLPTDGERLRLLAGSHVESLAGRCVQCGICSYNCPVGIDVRSYSRRALPVLESHCILCGECVARCPRGVLRFHRPAGAP